MAIQSSGLITLQDIEDEFGGSSPASLSEYYRGGAYTTDNNSGVPTSGAISLNDFYGASSRVTSLSIVNHQETAGDHTYVTMPTGLQVGDILIVSRSTNSSNQLPPSGWTSIKTAYSSNGIYYNWGCSLSYKVVTSTSESGTSVSGWGNGSSDTGATAWAIRPNQPASQINIQDTFGYAGRSSGGKTTINASDSSFCTISLASMALLRQNHPTTNRGIFRNALGGTDPIAGSQNYFAGRYDSEDGYDGNFAYAFCQTPDAAVDIYADNQSSIVNAFVSAYLEVV